MRQFIFYTREGCTEGPDGTMVENCQMLGEAIGETEREAFDELLRENSWIYESGFSISSGQIVARELAGGERYLF